MTAAIPKSAAPPAPRRDTTINMRLTVQMRDLIDSAADALGKTRSEFILDSARQQATDVLLDQRLFALGEADHAAFAEALDNPPAPPERLKALFAETAPWER